MITVSLCMIVKNEEKILDRCLSCVADLMDEIILVDTGSTDRTKEIAAKYTDKIHDFEWVDDFAAARNFAFSKAAMDYIYSADADEILDEVNRERFRMLKQALLPEIEMVQMHYCNQLESGGVYNYDREYRPKLFKRLRSFTWIDPIHETVRTAPVVFDSDIEILHAPLENHASRDLAAFARLSRRTSSVRTSPEPFERAPSELALPMPSHPAAPGASPSGAVPGKPARQEEALSPRLAGLYARELFIAGKKEDFLQAAEFFERMAEECDREDRLLEALCVAVRAARLSGDVLKFHKFAMKAAVLGSCSEICLELGLFHMEQKDCAEAAIWLYNAAFETQSILDIRCNKEKPFSLLAECYRSMGLPEEAQAYEKLARGSLS